jgi:hypothetical protein
MAAVFGEPRPDQLLGREIPVLAHIGGVVPSRNTP